MKPRTRWLTRVAATPCATTEVPRSAHSQRRHAISCLSTAPRGGRCGCHICAFPLFARKRATEGWTLTSDSDQRSRPDRTLLRQGTLSRTGRRSNSAEYEKERTLNVLDGSLPSISHGNARDVADSRMTRRQAFRWSRWSPCRRFSLVTWRCGCNAAAAVPFIWESRRKSTTPAPLPAACRPGAPDTMPPRGKYWRRCYHLVSSSPVRAERRAPRVARRVGCGWGGGCMGGGRSHQMRACCSPWSVFLIEGSRSVPGLILHI